MALKEKLLRIWRGDAEPELDPYNPDEQGIDRPLSQHDLNKIADSYGENEPGSTPNIPGGVGNAPFL
jgi:hypothetical protein